MVAPAGLARRASRLTPNRETLRHMGYGLQPAQRLVFQQASEKLDNYIVVRGTIAHRLNHGESVYRAPRKIQKIRKVQRDPQVDMLQTNESYLGPRSDWLIVGYSSSCPTRIGELSTYPM